MRHLACLLWLLSTPLAAQQHHLVIVSGIGGTEEYETRFHEQGERLRAAAIEAGIDTARIHRLVARTDAGYPLRADRATLAATLETIAAAAAPDDRVFIVLLGHGNPRGDSALFNLAGPDIEAGELARALDAFGERSLAIVNAASASGPFLRPLSGTERVVITATSSGREYEAVEFGEFFVQAFEQGRADRDKDERVSLLEAFDYARREVARSYQADRRLLTEHALLDDNGDGEGSLEPGEFEADGGLAARFYLAQPPTLADGASPQQVAQQARKRELEDDISELKRRRDQLERDDYYARLEALLIDLARLAQEIRAGGST